VKKLFCLLLVFSLVFSGLVFGTLESSALDWSTAQQKINQLRNTNYSGSYGGGSGCYGWLNLCWTVFFGSGLGTNSSNGEHHSNANAVCVGDHVRFYNGYTTDHSIFITYVDNNIVKYCEASGSNVTWNDTGISKSTLQQWINRSVVWTSGTGNYNSGRGYIQHYPGNDCISTPISPPSKPNAWAESPGNKIGSGFTVQAGQYITTKWYAVSGATNHYVDTWYQTPSGQWTSLGIVDHGLFTEHYLNNSQPGRYDFYVYAKNSAGNSEKCCVTVYVVPAYPTVPAGLTDVTASFANKIVYLKSIQSGKYVFTNGERSSELLLATSSNKGLREQYQTALTSSGDIGFRSLANNRYISANPDGVSQATSSSSAILNWESFRIYKKGDNYYLRARSNGHYLSAIIDVDWIPLKVSAANPGNWERFHIEIKPNDIPVTSVKIANAPGNLIVGKSQTLTATISPSNTTSSKTITWTSSKTSVATVDKNGKVTAKSPGTATITAKSSNGKTAKCTVTVHRYVTMKIGKSAAIMNGTQTTIDAVGTKPFKISGKTMLPLRFVGEKMGGKVGYKSDSQPITMSYGGTTVQFKLNSKTMTITKGKSTTTVTLDVAAQKIKGKTYIPLRAISQALGFDVYYEAGTEYIVVNNPKMTTAVKNARLSEAKSKIK